MKTKMSNFRTDSNDFSEEMPVARSISDIPVANSLSDIEESLLNNKLLFIHVKNQIKDVKDSSSNNEYNHLIHGRNVNDISSLDENNGTDINAHNSQNATSNKYNIDEDKNEQEEYVYTKLLDRQNGCAKGDYLTIQQFYYTNNKNKKDEDYTTIGQAKS